jgi:hypothetical protein
MRAGGKRRGDGECAVAEAGPTDDASGAGADAST